MSHPCMQGNSVMLGNPASANSGDGGVAAAAELAPAQSAPMRGGWWCFVAWGLIIAPFMPASNLFFWVCLSLMCALEWSPVVLTQMALCHLVGLPSSIIFLSLQQGFASWLRCNVPS